MFKSHHLSLRKILNGFLLLVGISWVHFLFFFFHSLGSGNENEKMHQAAPTAIVVGLPKSGTTSLYHFFSCSGIIATHYCCCGSNQTQYPCTNGRQVSDQLQDNWRQGRYLWEGLLESNVHTQLDGEVFRSDDYDYFLPQHYFLEELHQSAPKALWILPLRSSPEEWQRSVQHWLDLGDRLQRLYYQRYQYHNNGTMWLQDTKDKDTFLAHFYQLHTERIRTFCQQHRRPCIEVEIDDPSAGTTLARAIPGTKASCWGGRHNAGPFFQAFSSPTKR
jgi:hypothetical protein